MSIFEKPKTQKELLKILEDGHLVLLSVEGKDKELYVPRGWRVDTLELSAEKYIKFADPKKDGTPISIKESLDLVSDCFSGVKEYRKKKEKKQKHVKP